MIRRNILKKYYRKILQNNKVWVWIGQLYDKQKLLTSLYFKAYFDEMKSLEAQQRFAKKEKKSVEDKLYASINEFCEQFNTRIDIILSKEEALSLNDRNSLVIFDEVDPLKSVAISYDELNTDDQLITRKTIGDQLDILASFKPKSLNKLELERLNS